MWIGLLFGILAHAVRSYGRDKEVSPEQETNAALADLYRVRSAQCLTMAQLTKPVKYMVETLLLYSQLEFTEEGESDSGSWLLGGSAVRIAMQVSNFIPSRLAYKSLKTTSQLALIAERN